MEKIKGNKFLYSLGKFMSEQGIKLMNKNKSKVLTNLSYDFINPFTLMVNFVLDNTEKYQIVIQGDYKEKYIEWSKTNKDETNSLITEGQLYLLIIANRGKWFKKN